MRFVYCGLGLACVALGFVGAFLPLLPTTPFLILALMCFAKGSNCLHQWLLNHRILGKYLREWESDRVIPLKAKFTATIMIAFSSSYLALTSPLALPMLAGFVASMLLVLAYIWHFPSNVKGTQSSKPLTSVMTH